MNEIIRNVRVITGPSCEPVTLAQAREWCRIDTDDTSQDDTIELLISGTRERAEEITGRAFIERDLELLMDDLPFAGATIELPFAPLQYVSYIRYIDGSGAQQELSGSPDMFYTDAGSTPGRIAPNSGSSWPGTNGMPSNVRIGYRCGYVPVGSPPTEDEALQAGLPALLKKWMHQRIAFYYDHRDTMDLANIRELPKDFVDGLLDGLRVHRMFA